MTVSYATYFPGMYLLVNRPLYSLWSTPSNTLAQRELFTLNVGELCFVVCVPFSLRSDDRLFIMARGALGYASLEALERWET